MSKISGTYISPNSWRSRSPSAAWRTLPNTRQPCPISTLLIPQPIPVETPVTTALFIVQDPANLRAQSYTKRRAGALTQILQPEEREGEGDRAVAEGEGGVEGAGQGLRSKLSV